ncbi:MAG: hypothetical protein KAH44_23335, partial [Oricola sp.]|nr:hypothetical protein [Oricola sp.]
GRRILNRGFSQSRSVQRKDACAAKKDRFHVAAFLRELPRAMVSGNSRAPQTPVARRRAT